MRIVITKDGKTIIQEINPENKYKSLLERKSLKKRSSSNASYNTSNIITTNNNSFEKYQHQNSKSYFDLDTVFANFKTQENRTKINLKEINISSKNKLFLPGSILEKYETYNDYKTISLKNNNENKENSLMPEVYVSINKEIEKDIEEKGYDYVCKNFRTLNNMRMEEEELEKSNKINNKFTKRNSVTEDQNQNNSDKNKNDRTNNSLSSHFLPNILPAYPLKYIINRNSLNHVLKKVSQDEYNIKRGEKINENNFRTKISIIFKINI